MPTLWELRPWSNMRGYKVPGGLELHLRRSAIARPCPVMKAAWDLAFEIQGEKFKEEDSRAKERLAAPRKNEPVLLADPLHSPRRTAKAPCRQPRDSEGMVWAENRLRNLGFNHSVSKNVKRYKLERPKYVVYADPRSQGAIDCVVYEQPLRPKRRSHKCATFKIPDEWTDDLEHKFMKSLVEAFQGLSKWSLPRFPGFSPKRKGTPTARTTR
jgi:hypothetical protein